MIIADTRLAKEIENNVKAEWGGHAFFSSFDSQSRGVATFMQKNLPVKILDTFSDLNGNILSLLIEIENRSILVEGIYGPNRDEPNFYTNETFKRMNEWNPSYAIYAGDWNIALDPNIDTLNYQTENNPRARSELLNKMAELDLIDIFRELHPTDRKYSWKQWGNKKFSRLDYFLISNSLLPFVQKVEILTTCFSDHSPIVLEIDFSKFKRGRGFWKMNNSLLSDMNYVKIIKNTIKRVTAQYATINDEPNFFERASIEQLEQFYLSQTPESLQTLPLQINSELFLDTLMMEIRRATILYSAEKKRNRMSEELLLNHEIEILENNIQNVGRNDQRILEELQTKKDALENLYKYQAQGAFIRSRTTYKVEGEKPTRMFCALERYNGIQKYVPQLLVMNPEGQEILITNQQDVEKQIITFYKNLFHNKDDLIEINSIETFLGPNYSTNIPKLNEAQKTNMNGKISVQEMTKYLKKCKNNVSPGSSGFTNDFYKFFWRDLKYFVINSVDYAFDHNRLSATQSLGIINIIPKGDKDKRYLNNWRPLTLLNTLYKLISGCIAERIKPALPNLIHPDQKGFVAGRYIGEAIRTTYDTLNFAKENNRAGLILLIDFEKAYDSISFLFIQKCLTFYNFSDDIVKWVNILLYNFHTVINHCGNMSERFEIGRGCRQGDPIASYLFILVIEILAHRLRSDEGVQGFKVWEIRNLMEIYADDLTIFLKPCSQNLRNVVNNLTNFYKLSGLKISISKTKAIWFGNKCNSDEILCPDLSLKWVRNFTLLGINFNNNLDNMQNNFTDKIDKVEKMLSNWTYRYLTPFGKVTIIKTLGLSQLSHIALVIPNPNKEMVKRIENIFYAFIWSKKSEKVRREDCKLPVQSGGLGMPDILKFWTAFKFSWLRRILKTEAFWPDILLGEVSRILNYQISVTDLLSLGASKLLEVSKGLRNPFWKQVLSATTPLTFGSTFCYPEKILNSPFFNNPLIVRRRPITTRDFPELNTKVSIMADFFYPGTKVLMEWNDFCTRYNVLISNEKFIDIRHCLKVALQKLNLPLNRLLCVQYPVKPLLIDIATMCDKGCSAYYKILIKKDTLSNKIHLREAKWHLELNSHFSLDFWDKTRKLCASVDFDNQLKWLQYQIVRNSLQTNYIVSHFIANVSPICSYCKIATTQEKISHLFWFCTKVNEFLGEVFEFICSTGLAYSPSKIQFLFGFHDKGFYQPENFLTLIIKKYIWATKFKTANLSMAGLKNLIKMYVSDLKIIFVLKKSPDYFDEWNTILNNL